MIPPPITIMVIPMPTARIFEGHGVGVIEIENRAPAVRWRVRCRHRPAIVRPRSIRRLRPVRPIGPIRPICFILRIVFTVAVPPRPHHPLVRQVNLAACGGNLPGINGALGGTLQLIHPHAIKIHRLAGQDLRTIQKLPIDAHICIWISLHRTLRINVPRIIADRRDSPASRRYRTLLHRTAPA
jgi:hypothetical protein